MIETDFFLNPAIHVFSDSFLLKVNSHETKAALVLALGLQRAVEFAHTEKRLTCKDASGDSGGYI